MAITATVRKSTDRQVVIRQYRALLYIVFTSFLPVTIAFAQPAPLTSSPTETWTVTLPSDQVIGVHTMLNPGGVGCMNGDFNGSSAESFMCINESSPDSAQLFGYATSVSSLYKTPENLIPSSFLIFQATKNASSGFAEQTIVNKSVSREQLAIGGECAVADFDGDGRSDITCFGAQSVGNGGAFNPTYLTVWFSNGAAGSAPNSFLAPFSNSSDVFPAMSNGNVASAPETPFGPYCTVGHFMAGPGSQVLCNTVNLPYTMPTNNYVVFRFTASYKPSETISETEYSSTSNPPTWSTGPSLMFSTSAPSVLAANFGGDCLTGDFNGDGLTDIVCPTAAPNTGDYIYSNSSSTGSWTIGYSTGTGFKNVTWTPSPSIPAVNLAAGGGYPGDCTTGDFNGDGKTDIICSYSNASYNYSNADPRFEVYLANANGNGFQSGQVWSIPGVPAPVEIWTTRTESTPSWLNIFSSVCTVADLNGDGKSDVICYPGNTSNPAEWVYGLSTGSSFQAGQINSIVPPQLQFNNTAYSSSGITAPGTSTAPFAGACTLGDYLGNGLVDILCNPESMTGATSSTYTFSLAILSRSN